MSTGPKILVIRFTSIGDVVRVLPSVEAVHNAFPDAEISWAVDRTCVPLLDGHSAIDELLVFRGSKSYYRRPWQTLVFLNRVMNRKFDIILDYHSNNLAGLVSVASGARLRYGFPTAQCRGLGRVSSTIRIALPGPATNRLEQFFLLANAIGPLKRVAYPRLPETGTACEDFAPLSLQVGEAGKPCVAVHVANERPAKRWPESHMARLCDLLVESGACTVLLTWGPGQEKVARAVRRSVRNDIVMAKTPTLGHYVALMRRVQLYFGTDTGPMHIASALGVPVVCIFEGSNFFLHGPSRQPHAVLSSGRRVQELGIVGSVQERLRTLSHVTPEAACDACLAMLDRTGRVTA